MRAWNEAVSPEDVVYHLGDFAVGQDDQRISGLFARLAGEKHLILGNHDDESEIVQTLPWASVSQMKMVSDGDDRIFLCHYPMKTWPGARKGVVHGFGHMHARWRGTDRSLDLGVDAWGFRPVLMSDVRRRLRTLPADADFAASRVGAAGPRM